jgi:hypothetical protein
MNIPPFAIVAALAATGCQTTDWGDTPKQCQVRRAEAQLECTVTAEGNVSECIVMRDSARGCGFADGALEAAKKAGLMQGSVTGGAAGGKVRFIVRYPVDATGRIDPKPPSS